jgi:hypothetical protein
MRIEGLFRAEKVAHQNDSNATAFAGIRTMSLIRPAICMMAAISGAHAAEPRLNQMQVIGTHNSYKMAPHSELLKLLTLTTKRLAESIDYSHRTLPEQFGRLGIRQIELDVFRDPEGGLFAKPSSRTTLMNLGRDPGPDPNADGVLDKPGLKVLHVQDVDYATTAPTFRMALTQLRDWSSAAPGHVPILVLVELKDSSVTGLPTRPLPFDAKSIGEVDAEIDVVFPRSAIFAPDDLRGEFESLPDAISKRGWPELKAVRGKVLFALDNEGKLRDLYLEGSVNLSGRRMFVTAPTEDHPAAAFFKINDPVRDFDKIRAAVRAGFIVRTRADSDTRQARTDDTAQRDKALASGAQFVSTDYPEPRAEWSPYRVRFADGVIARPNPVSGIDSKVDDLE